MYFGYNVVLNITTINGGQQMVIINHFVVCLYTLPSI